MQSVLNVDKNVKFHSNQTEADLYIAENVMLNEDPREEIDIKLSASIYSQHAIFFYRNIFSFIVVTPQESSKKTIQCYSALTFFGLYFQKLFTKRLPIVVLAVTSLVIW